MKTHQEIASTVAAPAPIEDVWREFSDELRRFIVRRVPQPQDADDILQLVALRLVQHSHEPRDRRTLLAWLYAVTRNAIADHYRAPAHRREVLAAAPPEAATIAPSDEEDHQALTDLSACVRPLLRLLVPEQAEAVRLVDLDGSSQVAAARTLGISVSGMKSRVQRGRRALHDALTACCQLQFDARGEVREFQAHAEADCSCATCSSSSRR